MLKAFENKGSQIKWIVGILFGCFLLQTASRVLTDYATIISFKKLSPVEWEADLDRLAPGNYYVVIGRPQGICDVLVDGKIWVSNRSGLSDIRSQLFLGFPLLMPLRDKRPSQVTVSCLEQAGFKTSFYKIPVIMGFGSGIISLLVQEVYSSVVGPIFSFFLIWFLFLTTAVNRRKLKINNYFLFFAIFAFCYSISLAHITSLFLNGPGYTLFHIFTRICFSLSFILLCGSYTRQRWFLIVPHFLLLIVLFWYSGSPDDVVNFYYTIFPVFALSSSVAFYDLFKLKGPTKFENVLAALTAAWTIFQLRDFVALRSINGYYSGPLMISLFTGFLAYFNYQEAIESEKETEALKTELGIKTAIADLSAQVAHDIRAPLAFLKVVQEDKSFSAEVKNNMNIAISRLNGIIEQLLKRNREGVIVRDSTSPVIFKASEEEFSRVDVKEVVANLIHEKKITLGADAKIRFNVKADPKDRCEIRVQRAELERLISNILSNAIEAISDEGSISLEVTKSEQQVIFSVIDSGSGIKPEILDILGRQGGTFGKVSGSGLGLFHAKRTIESWGGQLEIISEVGMGTTVRLTFCKDSGL